MNENLTLLTDLYQLTMAAGYWKAGIADRRASFALHFRKAPFGGAYAICAGLAPALEYLEGLRFEADDLAYLRSLTQSDGSPLFEAGFLDFLASATFDLDVDGIAEGTAVFPHTPLLRITGPLWQVQLVESALLNIINFQTLIATKAHRICRAATDAEGNPEPVLEFGLRRAQGVDGSLSASRAAYIGGCAATSNVLAGKRYGIPVKGTHAHSWVMAFDSEGEAFRRYADTFPKSALFLVDTYNTLEGVRKAIEVGRELRAAGHDLSGIRLDSGDLAALAIDARRLLDEGGFENAKIVASNDLDEYRIRELRERGAPITVWGVGTRLSTSHDQPALGGVYKLTALEDDQGSWQSKIKASSSPGKTSIPGFHGVRRLLDENGKAIADVLFSEDQTGTELLGEAGCLPGPTPLRNVAGTEERILDAASSIELLTAVLRKGKRCRPDEAIDTLRSRSLAQAAGFDQDVFSTHPTRPYFVGLDGHLEALRRRLIAEYAP